MGTFDMHLEGREYIPKKAWIKIYIESRYESPFCDIITDSEGRRDIMITNNIVECIKNYKIAPGETYIYLHTLYKVTNQEEAALEESSFFIDSKSNALICFG